MKIAISTSVIQRGKTGVAQHIFALVRSLLAHTGKHNISLLVLEEDMPLFDFARNGMNLIPVPEKYRPATKNIAWHQTYLPGLLRQGGFDVMHVPSYRRLLWARPCAMVATIHDLAPFHVAGKYDWARMFYGRVVVRHLSHRQDQIIAVSHNTAKDIERFFKIPASLQNVIHNGIDHVRFQPGSHSQARSEALQQWRLDNPFFLYISRLEHPGKNHVRLIEAFNRFKKETGSNWLLALGGSDWHGAQSIHDAAAQSPFHKDIRFLGFVSNTQLPLLYQAADCFIYPSLFEGFGMPPVEAMACGCPVISSTRGALEEVVADAAELIDPENIEQMAGAMNSLARDPAKRECLVQKGKANAARFDWDANAKAVLGVYQKALACAQQR